MLLTISIIFQAYLFLVYSISGPISQSPFHIAPDIGKHCHCGKSDAKGILVKFLPEGEQRLIHCCQFYGNGVTLVEELVIIGLRMVVVEDGLYCAETVVRR